MLADFHLHTIVSDGELPPEAVLAEAARRGITHVSITDHDALGAYRWQDGLVFAEARRLSLALTVGIEMDADMDGIEVHVLGFELRLDDPALLGHLERVRAARFERARREVGIVNGLLGAGTIREEEIFVRDRETLMKPHFIHPILAKGLFPSYEQANAWYRTNVKTGIAVPKPGVGEAISLIHGAGGWAALAHPAYYERDGLPAIASRLPALRALGLDGVEVDYPYHACSPHAFTKDAEQRFVEDLRAAAGALGLRTTRGSDSHTAADFLKVYGE